MLSRKGKSPLQKVLDDWMLRQAERYFRQKALMDFCIESNEIENITDQKRHDGHLDALEKLLSLETIQVSDLEAFVKSVEPSAFLRTDASHRVWIGGQEAPKGAKVKDCLEFVLNQVSNKITSPYRIHRDYEQLHPFIDGNGRSGRALWLWGMVRHHKYDLSYGFLRMWYYQSLAEG